MTKRLFPCLYINTCEETKTEKCQDMQKAVSCQTFLKKKEQEIKEEPSR